ncbi:U3 protein [Tibrovirus congo]|uniref:U3 protein n=1 Tax=Tibrovirus congo TaxID=1987017 RepID=K0A1N5_9RHAB|nr:U3 protein [Tibrovirus congo]AFS65342.1 U3 protein [Tibrovirus congo]
MTMKKTNSTMQSTNHTRSWLSDSVNWFAGMWTNMGTWGSGLLGAVAFVMILIVMFRCLGIINKLLCCKRKYQDRTKPQPTGRVKSRIQFFQKNP